MSMSFAKIMGFVAVTLAAVNIFGGFIVTAADAANVPAQKVAGARVNP